MRDPSAEPARLKALLHGVREGRLFDLSQPLSPMSPHLPMQPQYRINIDHLRLPEAMPSRLPTEVFAEHVAMTLHTGTHVDALGHFAADGHWCHGVKARPPSPGAGIGDRGIDHLGPMIARAVVLDVAAWSGVSVLEGGTRVTRAMLAGTAAVQRVEVERGDVVLVRTGWARYYGLENDRYVSSEPGIDEDAAHYLSERGAVAVGADNMALEVMPLAAKRRVFPVHRHLLAEAGIHIIENLQLDAACAAAVRTALFVLLPVRYVGGTAAPVMPILLV